MPGQDDVVRRLRAAGINPPGSLGLDVNDRALIDRITNANDAQVALAKQQMRINDRQLTSNERNQEIAQAQWLLVYAADLFKFCADRDMHELAHVRRAAQATILRALEDEPTTPTQSQPTAADNARAAVAAMGHDQVYTADAASGFVEHEPAE